MADVNVFDVADTVLTVDKFQITDFASGDPITAVKDADDVTVDQDVMGNSWGTMQHKGTGTMTVRLLPGTPSYRKVMELHDKKTVFEVMLDTPQDSISATKSLILRSPQTAITGGSPVREFQIKMLDYKHNAK